MKAIVPKESIIKQLNCYNYNNPAGDLELNTLSSLCPPQVISVHLALWAQSPISWQEQPLFKSTHGHNCHIFACFLKGTSGETPLIGQELPSHLQRKHGVLWAILEGQGSKRSHTNFHERQNRDRKITPRCALPSMVLNTLRHQRSCSPSECLL